MNNYFRTGILTVLLCGVLSWTGDSGVFGREPSWYPYTIARGMDRDWIRETPIELRPYRPFHFYGNTQRRRFYRGNPLPQARDYRDTFRSLIRRR